MTAISAKPLFRAISGHRPEDPVHGAWGDTLPALRAPEIRRKDDFYPTTSPEAVTALLGADGDRIAALGRVWEPAVGDGAMARPMLAAGLEVVATDIVDRGWPGTSIGSFLDHLDALAPAIITNPPYNLINARDGRGEWLRHTLAMPGWRYCALLLSWDWPAAFTNGLGAMLDDQPFSWCYLMRWKIDFTGAGSPPQRNAWFVWDRDDPRGTRGDLPEPSFRWLDRPCPGATGPELPGLAEVAP